jgi:Ca-activated chloride channel family protein
MDIFLTTALWASALASPEEEDRLEFDFEGFGIEGNLVSPSSLGVTPGGAQDISYFRDRVEAGEVPLPEVFTAEGLFSEHDLPLVATRRCERLVCTNVAATEASLLVQPEVRWLAQVGFTSGLDAATFERAPLDLVAVVDKSCSMSDAPIETVKHALSAVVRELGPQDQLSIVLYGSTVDTLLPPTRASDRGALQAAIDAIAIDGSTHMEAGLQRGFELARSSRRTFDGTTRVMLFTDERPNTGRTDAESFMGMAEAASREGVGMTTVGVGVQFGAELAQKVSSVRGGNLLFFSDVAQMRETFAEEFDYLVTELGYDLDLTLHPAPGLRIAGVYGVPGELVEWVEGGGVHLHVSTLFLSERQGAIYVSMAPGEGQRARERAGESLGTVSLSYDPRDGARTTETAQVLPADLPLARGQEGLSRGVVLVDELTTLKKATALHHEANDQESAWRLLHELSQRMAHAPDPELASERELVDGLRQTLARLAGRAGEAPTVTSVAVDPVTGLPSRR